MISSLPRALSWFLEQNLHCLKRKVVSWQGMDLPQDPLQASEKWELPHLSTVTLCYSPILHSNSLPLFQQSSQRPFSLYCLASHACKSVSHLTYHWMKIAATLEEERAVPEQRDNTGMDGSVHHTLADRWANEGDWKPPKKTGCSAKYSCFAVLSWAESMKYDTLSINNNFVYQKQQLIYFLWRILALTFKHINIYSL